MGHKGVVIRCIEAVCDNGQLLVDIFVNYDCDLEGANLFERLVLAMVRIAQGNQDKETQVAAGPEENALRLTVSLSLHFKGGQYTAAPFSIPQRSNIKIKSPGNGLSQKVP